MNQSESVNDLATLSSVLLSNLDEAVFFSKITDFILQQTEEYKVLAYEAMFDGSTALVAENGKAVSSKEVLAKGIGLSGYVARMKRAYYSNNVKRDPITAHSKRDDVVEAELCVPIMYENTVIGTVHIQSVNNQRNFNESDIKMISDILNQIAAPIKNMRMYLMAKNLNRELEQKLLKQNNQPTFKSEIKQGTQSDERLNLIGMSTKFLNTIQMAKKLAVQDFPILLEGNHGTGKKILARKIHFWSHRKNNNCVLVHCSSIAENALDVELFGQKSRPGAFAQANGGTLIIDDISALSPAIQAKVLRTMITGEIVTADQMERMQVNVRLITISKTPLMEKVESGEFKEELYYRLNTMGLRLPTLKERSEDIKILAEYFLNEGKDKAEAKLLTSGCLNKLLAYHWPGNIQELRNLMDRLSVVVEGTYIDEKHLPDLAIEEVQEPVVAQKSQFNEETLHELEKNHILNTLTHLGGNKTRAAKSLGITVKTLYNKLHSYGAIDTGKEV